MRIIRVIALLALGLSVSACANTDGTTRNGTTPLSSSPAPQTIAAKIQQQAAAGKVRLAPGQVPVRVRKVTVTVPRTLKVSEDNTYLPHADIVWRGDPYGDRYVQVQKIVAAGIAKGVRSLNGPIPVDLQIEVKRFHALTEKARYMVGGVHNIEFILAIRDPRTGALLVPARMVIADLRAYGGREAIKADARGETQKVRIIAFLAGVIQDELTKVDGFRNPELGLVQAMNHF